jgi:hypothetical protein
MKLYKRYSQRCVTSARFIAQSAWVKWSQLRLFKAKEGRSYLQGSVYI